MPPTDDDYTVLYEAETSTVDNEYLKNHNRMNKQLQIFSTLDEELSSVCSTNITNGKMLDYIVHGYIAKDDNTSEVSILYIGHSTNSENYNTNTSDSDGNHSYSSSENLKHENEAYMSESAAFCNTTPSITSASESRVSSIANNETLSQSTLSETTVNLPDSMTSECQQEDHNQSIDENNIKQNNSSNSTTFSQHTSSLVGVSSNENSTLSVIEGYIHAAGEIRQPASVGEQYENRKSPVEYLPYTTAIDQGNSSVCVVEEKDIHVTGKIQPAELQANGNSPVALDREYFPYTTTIDQKNSSAAIIPSLESNHDNSV